MRGDSYEHHTMIELPERCAVHHGAQTEREHFVRLGESHGYIDLLIGLGPLLIANEAENDSRRVENDVRKAVALRATHLLIVTPTAAVARACKRKLAGIPIPAGGLKVLVCTLGTALHRLSALLASASAAQPTTPKDKP